MYTRRFGRSRRSVWEGFGHCGRERRKGWREGEWGGTDGVLAEKEVSREQL
jgi:hypothetical protein